MTHGPWWNIFYGDAERLNDMARSKVLSRRSPQELRGRDWSRKPAPPDPPPKPKELCVESSDSGLRERVDAVVEVRQFDGYFVPPSSG